MIETKSSEYVYTPESGERWDTQARRIRPVAGQQDGGKLIDHGTHWRVIYDHCGHFQDFARIGLFDVGSAVREVKHHYAQCLTCRSTRAARLAVPVAVPAQGLLWSEADEVEMPVR